MVSCDVSGTSDPPEATGPGGGPLKAGPGGGSLRVDPDGALKSGPEGISSPPFRPQAERLSAATATIPNRTVRRQKAKDTLPLEEIIRQDLSCVIYFGSLRRDTPHPQSATTRRGAFGEHC